MSTSICVFKCFLSGQLTISQISTVGLLFQDHSIRHQSLEFNDSVQVTYEVRRIMLYTSLINRLVSIKSKLTID